MDGIIFGKQSIPFYPITPLYPFNAGHFNAWRGYRDVGARAKAPRNRSLNGLRSLGSNLLMIRQAPSKVGGVALEAGSVTRFTLRTRGAWPRAPGSKNVAENVRAGQVVYADKNWNTQVQVSAWITRRCTRRPKLAVFSRMRSSGHGRKWRF